VPERRGVPRGDCAKRASEAARGEESRLEKEMVWNGELDWRGRLVPLMDLGVLIAQMEERERCSWARSAVC
jgi:hypothetical protein